MSLTEIWKKSHNWSWVETGFEFLVRFHKKKKWYSIYNKKISNEIWIIWDLIRNKLSQIYTIRAPRERVRCFRYLKKDRSKFYPSPILRLISQWDSLRMQHKSYDPRMWLKSVCLGTTLFKKKKKKLLTLDLLFIISKID